MLRRLIIYYVILGTLVVGLSIAIFLSAGDTKAQPSIAGGYDVAPPAAVCAGTRLDVRQSGQFAGMQRPDGTVVAKLRLRDRLLTGELRCRDDTLAQIVIPIPESKPAALVGTLGGAPFRAELKRDAPAPGAQRPRPPPSMHGEYKLTPRSDCLKGGFELERAGDEYEVVTGRGGSITYEKGALEGRVRCGDGSERVLEGQAANRDLTLTLTASAASSIPPEKLVASKQREFGKTIAAFFVAVAIVMLFARLTGALFVRLKMPRVMGEVLAGIMLGPTLLGALAPEVQRMLFPADVIPYIGVAANLGLIFYMFLVGLELDLSQLRGRLTQTAAISNTGVALPMLAGIAVAVPTYQLVGPESQGGFAAFALFMGVAMSITAFPVLARILVERRMLTRPLGSIALASAAIDDLSAWVLIAVATAVATAGGGTEVMRTILLAIAFCLVMALAVKPVIARASLAYDEAGRVPVTWITAIFAGILLSAYATEEIGIALILGGFVMGLIMPRHAGLTEDVTHRVEDFVVLLLLPLFFAFTGLRTNVLLLDRSELILITVALLVVAVVCKFGGTMLAARVTGFNWRESAVLGTLMNTRGLTELIVLNLALEKGVISEALFAALVIMALVTTFMAGPLLRLIDPRNEYGEPVEAELERALEETAGLTPMPIPDRAILVAPQTEGGIAQLLALAEPLATSEPPREIILVKIVPPPRGTAIRAGLQTEGFLLAEAAAQMERVRGGLLERRVPARAVAFSSADGGRDISKLAEREGVDLVLLDGRRPLLGDGVPRGEVGSILRRAPSDVALLVAREDATIALGSDAALVVPFGGADHDWAALEIGAWLSTTTGSPLRLLGVAGDEGEDASRLLASASLLVQRFTGVAAEPLIAEPGQDGLLRAAAGAGLLLIGLSERWREEGLGATRREIAAAAPAPILFVRRGLREGALAPRTDVTRFPWSSPGISLR